MFEEPETSEVRVLLVRKRWERMRAIEALAKDVVRSWRRSPTMRDSHEELETKLEALGRALER